MQGGRAGSKQQESSDVQESKRRPSLSLSRDAVPAASPRGSMTSPAARPSRDVMPPKIDPGSTYAQALGAETKAEQMGKC